MNDKDSDAKVIYAAMLKAARDANPSGKYPEWVEQGNSDMQEEARRAAGRLTAERDALRKALADLLEPFEDEECRLDHHGYCQAHFVQADCCVKAARTTLNSFTSDQKTAV